MKNAKAVALARDVLAQLRTGRLIATSGVYFEDISPKELLDLWHRASAGKRAQVAPCEVCALGALFIKHLETGAQSALSGLMEEVADHPDELDSATHTALTLPARARIAESMAGIFSEGECEAMEDVFEGNDWIHGVDRWMDRFPADRDRMAAIMLAVVKAGGKFPASSRMPTYAQVEAALAPPRKARRKAKRRS